jgi:hypothetical protein
MLVRIASEDKCISGELSLLAELLRRVAQQFTCLRRVAFLR